MWGESEQRTEAGISYATWELLRCKRSGSGLLHTLFAGHPLNILHSLRARLTLVNLPQFPKNIVATPVRTVKKKNMTFCCHTAKCEIYSITHESSSSWEVWEQLSAEKHQTFLSTQQSILITEKGILVQASCIL
ncbi:hypothetical protein CSB45_01005 [candidate division KSB3 bacterium]|uniref:Uncharacterized protein n=1 Tax=candidate division KSB3 bacterium TaxID=2044937 RepID=A0A2G6EB72_9BACT|nr:MAG: hypothetical protein CSB45_01005 [candidate division KSB3 bacterium]